jgi:hypothetical protein
MPVLSKSKLERITVTLGARMNHLLRQASSRPLLSPKEGAGKGHWVHPELMVATEGDAMDLRMAVSDFRTILKEIETLK